MHDVPMQEQENCFIFGFDGIWTYDRVFNGFTNFVSTRYGFPFSHLQTSEISSDGETPKFDKMTAALRSTSLRALLAVASQEHLSLDHFEVTSAFTQAEIDTLLYVEPPKGFPNLQKNDRGDDMVLELPLGPQ